MPTIRINSETPIHAETGTSILDAASAASIQLPYSCKTGRCGTCKCRLIEGTTTTRLPEAGLSDAEKAAGWILSCVRSAQTDLEIEAETLGDIALPAARTLPCRISALDRPAVDVLRVRLRLPPTQAFAFLPGQYIELIGHNGLRRSFSLANASAPGGELELHVRAIDGGAMSRYLFDVAKVGDLLRLRGPLGTFFLRDIAGRDLYFLATGTGIAPVKAMLEALSSADEQPRSVTVLWGGRQPADLYLDMASILGNHSFIPVLSRADAAWEGARGHVQDVLLARRPDLSNAAVYACGSDAMIHSARAALTQAGMAEQQFHSDAFVCSSPTTTPEP